MRINHEKGKERGEFHIRQMIFNFSLQREKLSTDDDKFKSNIFSIVPQCVSVLSNFVNPNNTITKYCSATVI